MKPSNMLPNYKHAIAFLAVALLICFDSISCDFDAVSGTMVLSNGVQMPSIGIGCYGEWGEDARRMVEMALDSGYRSIDTANLYQNEAEVGQAIKNKIADGTVPRREDLFVTTKFAPSDFTAGQTVEDRLRGSLSKLKLDYVDLYLYHWPSSRDANIENWKGLIAVYNKGLAKSVGVSNFNSAQLQEIIDATSFTPHNVQNRAYMGYNNDDPTLTFCNNNNISFTAYSPLGAPGRNPNTPLTNQNVKQIAARLNKTPAQVALRYLLQRGMAVIPKSGKKERIQENFEIFDFALTDEDMETLKRTTL